MAKNIIKEIIIFILILISLALLLLVLFYDYAPNSKMVPSKVVPYKMSADVEEDLKKEPETEAITPKPFKLTRQEIELYKYEDYDPGKVNPFAKETEAEENNIPSNNVIKNNIIEEENNIIIK